MVRGDKPIELGNSWFSAKTIEVVRHMAGYPEIPRLISGYRAASLDAYILTQ